MGISLVVFDGDMEKFRKRLEGIVKRKYIE